MFNKKAEELKIEVSKRTSECASGKLTSEQAYKKEKVMTKKTYSVIAHYKNWFHCEVEAENEDEAIQQLMDGCHEPVDTEWVDWATGGYEFEAVEELDPLYRMVKEYTPTT